MLWFDLPQTLQVLTVGGAISEYVAGLEYRKPATWRQHNVAAARPGGACPRSAAGRRAGCDYYGTLATLAGVR